MENSSLKNINPNSLVELFSQAPVALSLLMGKDFVIENANQHILELWGKSEDVIGMPLLKAIPELEGQEFLDILADVLNTGNPFHGYKVSCWLNRNGGLNEFFFDFIYAPVYGNNNEISGVSVVATEVTSLVESEKKLRDSEIRFKELLLNADYSTAIYVGEDLIIELANDKMLKTWGKDKSVIGMPLEKALPELEGQPFIDLLKNVYRTGETYAATEDKVDLLVDGKLQTFYYNFTYKPIRNAQGEIYAILNMAVNVTNIIKSRLESHKIAEKLKISESKYKNLSEAMPQLVWTASCEGKLNYFNERLTEYLGVSRDDLDVDFGSFIHPEDLPNVVNVWYDAAEKKSQFEVEYRIKHKDSENYIWVLTRAVPELDSDGNIIQWIGSSTDINEFKILQNQKDTFLGIASHELKTPLTSIKIYAQVLEKALKKTGDLKYADFAKKMDEQVMKLTSLIGDLLDVTKISSGKMQLNLDYFNFSDLVNEVVTEQQLSSKHIIINNSEEIGNVYGDRNRISQVMTNLISNAIKYSPDAAEVIVSSKIVNNCAQFCVQDFGIGMSEDKKDKVFEQYYRVSGDEQHTFPGLGLGLYIASQIIERSHGKIWVNSILGKGSTFCFSVPIDFKN